ncbi:UNVERIFIED_ORG: retron-type reverse transcriptase [Idiomarina abyssalis]|uniref:retron St85 family RNA-directed DNA polymerase n=1 Tax=Idiomarina sp. 017G TaxID=2183988 RepID=UPI000E0FD6D0|nr:retron St85 family RNA-directed DNA polymerase [Idiomarina sp. 017G]TDO51877.1 retron-type reverse transcriptase [Idiomarina sp. 017G]
MPQDSHIYRLRNLGLPVMKSSEDFANYTKLSASRIRLLHLRADKFYKVYRLPKKSGGTRLIAQPSRELKALQGWILRNILDKLRASDQSKGFEIGSSILDNAAPHTGANFILNIDLEDFFPSIKANRIFSIFRSIGYNKELCVLLTNLCTYSGRLPQGAPTSPKLANLTCAQLDARIQGYAGPKGIIYTRYADDITLSAQTATKIYKARYFLDYLIADEGFTINRQKTRVYGTMSRKCVTGLVVSESAVGIGREKYREIRAQIHHLFSGKADSYRYLNGLLAFCFSVDTKSYRRAYKYMRKLQEKYPNSNAMNSIIPEKE